MTILLYFLLTIMMSIVLDFEVQKWKKKHSSLRKRFQAVVSNEAMICRPPLGGKTTSAQ